MSHTPSDILEAARQLEQAAAAKKCWVCGCLHGSLESIDAARGSSIRPDELSLAIRRARERLQPVKYDCIGCEVCYPAIAVNAMGVEADACPAENVSERAGWPPLPGAYRSVRYGAPVAVCTLTDDTLMQSLAAHPDAGLSIVGTLQTENLGIERLIANVLANPNIRFLVVCGSDSRKAVGHLPGQSLVALARFGLDEDFRIIGAGGKRPRIRNLGRDGVEHFRRTVEVVDLVGESESSAVLKAVAACAGRNPGPVEPFASHGLVVPIMGYLPEHMVSDPAGYFVLYPDPRKGLLSLEHYQNDGVLDAIIEARTPSEVYTVAVERGLVSRLDHAAYLGKELARAERALSVGEPYVQDAAAELSVALSPSVCGCTPPCSEAGS